MSKRKFTNEELQIAIKLFNSGKSYREIGRKLNRSHDTIRRHLSNSGYVKKVTLRK